MIPTSKDFERHPTLGTVMVISLCVLIASGAFAICPFLLGQPVNLGLEIDWEKVLPVIIKFAAETLVAAYSVFRLLKPIETRLVVVEAKLDLMGSATELRRILQETD